MKLFAALFLLAVSFFVLLMCGCSSVHTHQYVAPSLSEVSTQVSGARQTTKKADALVQGAVVKLKQVPLNVSPAIKDVVDDLINADVVLKDSDSKLAASEQVIAKKQKENDALAASANAERDGRNKLAIEHNHDMKIIWRDRAIFAGIGLLLIGYLALKFKWLALPLGLI